MLAVIVHRWGLEEWKGLFHSLDVRVGNKCSFSEETLTLTILLLKNVSLTLFTAKDLACTGDLEALCY